MPVRLCVLLLVCVAGVVQADAASLSVSPIGIDRVAPAAAASLTLRNTGDRAIVVQARVYRWRQVDGADRLEPTRDVAISPPMTELASGADQTIRVVRLSKAAVAGEEAYRILVDELPDRSAGGENAVQFVVRYSIPAFFREPGLGRADVAWSAEVDGRSVMLTGVNAGGTRLKVGRTTLEDARGRTFELSAGLIGYVLAGATMTWRLPTDGADAPRAGAAALTVAGDGDALHVPLVLQPRR